jgi:hypothetical protein
MSKKKDTEIEDLPQEAPVDAQDSADEVSEPEVIETKAPETKSKKFYPLTKGAIYRRS